MIPWNESEIYTLPCWSKVRAFRPGLPMTVAKTDDAPLSGFTFSTCPLPKSITSRAPVVGWKSSPSSWLLEPATVTWRCRRPSSSNTKSCPAPEGGAAKVVAEAQRVGARPAGGQRGEALDAAAIPGGGTERQKGEAGEQKQSGTAGREH